MRRWCRHNVVLLALLAMAVSFAACGHDTPLALARMVDWPTMGALCGLLCLAYGIERSGALRVGAARLLQHVNDRRRLALLLVGLSALLAAVVTNDVSLFVLVPLTRALAEQARLPLARFIALEALAVNAGSSLTPIGNPQNLFLWHVSGLPMHGYVAMMAPCVALMVLLLMVTVYWIVPAEPVGIQTLNQATGIDRPLLLTSVVLFVVFVAALQAKLLIYVLPLVIAIFLIRHRSVLRSMDWGLLVVIALMFIDLRALGATALVSKLLQQLPLANRWVAYGSGIVLSQIISNVPATILLQPHVSDLSVLARAVNIGGFGLVVGSLANFIALRLARAPGGMWEFHRVAVPFLFASAAICAPLR